MVEFAALIFIVLTAPIWLAIGFYLFLFALIVGCLLFGIMTVISGNMWGWVFIAPYIGWFIWRIEMGEKA